MFFESRGLAHAHSSPGPPGKQRANLARRTRGDKNQPDRAAGRAWPNRRHQPGANRPHGTPELVIATPAMQPARGPSHGLRGQVLSDSARLRPVVHDLVDQAEIAGFLGRHIGVALQLALDRLDRLAGMAHIDLVQPLAQRQDLARLDLDVGRLALGAAGGLVDHDARVRQGDSACPWRRRSAAGCPSRRPGRCTPC